ncbi:unnamed protein product [Protopolystoma xenopodis]|uniref:Uncharacterized protein n=1 Tax=Protopolystoma xenopodis TaxID=117903 RepID=A0A448X515_9PLAT|nr:unnamed protein product [Protopolystoma xenopodis]
MGLTSVAELELRRHSRHKHRLRHSLELSIAFCPAWLMTPWRVQARHQLCSLAGRWPVEPMSKCKCILSVLHCQLIQHIDYQLHTKPIPSSLMERRIKT